MRAEKLDEAENIYRGILAISPNHVQSLIGLGKICSTKGEKKDTDQLQFSQALKVRNQSCHVCFYQRECGTQWARQ